ncbi:hypothetical protein VKT23_009686 [Stygiomarasmius scandens]|uniref:Uncharacterized protein n=1 Tax=Marasmiellus scandens TaxID=2682957 RepID=A0ABR1JH65_9AGAR
MSNRPLNFRFTCKPDSVIHFVQPSKSGPVFWSSLNTNTLPQAIPDYSPEIPAYSQLPSFQKPRWSNNLYPFIAFVPAHLGFEGNLFSRLVQTLDPVPIGIRYKMHSRDLGRWQRLESNLIDISSFLMQRAGIPGKMYQYLWLPESLGYDRTFREPEHVRSCMARTRSAFIFLMAVCSFAVAMNLQDSDLRDSDDEPSWAKACRLEKPTPVHPQWLADFRKSIVCDFTPGLRAGGFFHGYDSQWACAFPALARANVPFWIWWGDSKGTLIDKRYMPSYLPSHEQKKEALKRLRVVPESQDDDADAPIPFSGSYQVRGETYIQFHHRLQEEAKVLEEMETSQEKAQREDLTRRADLDNATFGLEEPSVGLAMYEWIWYGKYALRRIVSRREWRWKWESSPSVHRHYIPHLYQWDIEPFAQDSPQLPSGYGGESIWVPDSYYDNDAASIGDGESHSFPVGSSVIEPRPNPSPTSQPNPSPTSQPNPSPTSQPNPSSTSVDYVEDVRSIFGSTISTIPVHQVQSVFDVMRFRLGFCPPIPFIGHEHLHTAGSNSHTRAKDDHALFAIGLRTAVEFQGKAEVHSAQENIYRTFLHNMYNYTVSDNPKFFSPLFDFAPSMLNSIEAHSRWVVAPVPLNSKNLLPTSTWQGPSIYILGVKGEPLVDQWYLLGLYDATTVLQLFRQNPAGDMGVLAAARELLQWGIPFITLKPLLKAPSKPEKQQRFENKVGLGVRQENHQFDSAEYTAYEAAKNDVLLSSKGRLALMQGGILWRLAKDIVASQTVPHGPRSSVKQNGISFGSLDDHDLCEEVLTEDEVNTIVGLYKVDTGTRNQTSDRSWWPKPGTWAKGNRTFGYWTADDEKFYQQRLIDIRKGTARPKKASQWYNDFHTKSDSTVRFYGQIEDASRLLLDGQSAGYWKD